MKSVSYQGTKSVLLRTLRKCAMRGWNMRDDSDKIREALDKAARQEAARRTLSASQGGIA